MLCKEGEEKLNKLQEHWTRQQEQLDSLEKKLEGIGNGCSLSQQNLAELKLLKSLVFKSTHIKTCTMISDELKNEINKLKKGIHVIYDENLTEDIIKRLDNIEDHDIFKVWKSVRKGGKITLATMLNLNQGIKGLRGRINREQERINILEKKFNETEKQTERKDVSMKKVVEFSDREIDLVGEKVKAGVVWDTPLQNYYNLVESKLPKLNVPEKYQPYEDVSLDPTKPIYLPKKFTPFESEYKPIEEITVKRKDPVEFDMRVDLPDDLPCGKLMEAPDTIDFNGTLYCKITDVVNDIYKLGSYGTFKKYEALLNE